MDPPIQKLLHAVDVLCIDYYEACQRKNRANRWNDCHPRIECPDSKIGIKNLLGFRARASRISSLASGRGGPRYCGGQQSGLKNGRSSPTVSANRQCSMQPPTGERAGSGGVVLSW
jgi:hypothetical protein